MLLIEDWFFALSTMNIGKRTELNSLSFHEKRHYDTVQTCLQSIRLKNMIQETLSVQLEK